MRRSNRRLIFAATRLVFLSALTLPVFTLAPISAHAENIIFPGDANVINVRNAPYNATGNGTTDDTAALQRAIRDGLDGSRVVYIPNGTYLVSDRLIWRRLDTSGFSQGWGAYLVVQGQSRAGTVIKLKNNAPGYNTPAAPKAVIYTASRDDQNVYDDATGPGNQAFYNSLRNLTVDTGTGNSGAIGIDYQVSNIGSLRDVTVRSGDGAGVTGVSLTRRDNGPGLLKNVEVIGFQYGIRFRESFAYAFTLENITVRNQTVAGIDLFDMPTSLRNLTSVNSVPALVADNFTHLTLLGANLSGGSSANPAIDLKSGNTHAYLRGVVTSGYRTPVNNRGTDVAGPSLSEFTTDDIKTLGPSRRASLNLPIKETPEYFDENLANWKSVTSGGAVPNDGADDTAGIQAALDAGKTTVYFPTGEYRIGNTLRVPSNVRHIVGLEARLLAATGNQFTDGRPTFRFEGGVGQPVVMEGFHNEIGGNNVGVQVATPRTVVLKDMQVSGGTGAGVNNTAESSGGDLFVEDVSGSINLGFPRNVWARQYNPEGPSPKTVNRGGSFWLLGFKSENANTQIETYGGGKVEVLGGNIYCTGDAGPGVPAFISDESSLSVSVAATAFVPGFFFDNWIREVRNGASRDLPTSAGHGRGLAGGITLFAGDAQVALNAGGGTNGVFSDENTTPVFGNTGTYFTSDPIDLSGVTNPAPGGVYQSERNDLGGGFSYLFAGFLPNQPVRVRLHFAERYFDTVGSRVFNTAFNGVNVLSNFDIRAAAGAKNKAVVRDIDTTANPVGRIGIAFASLADRALVNGIEILGGVSVGTGLQADYFDNIDFTGPAVTRLDPTVDFWWGNNSPDPAIAPDTFSARWTGFVQPDIAGSYRFQTRSDDGVRVWVDGVLVINNWTNHAPTDDTSAAVTLDAGRKYAIRMEYFENGGGAEARLRWSRDGGAFQTIPVGHLYPAVPEGTGLKAEYFNNETLSGIPGRTAIDPTINFVWGSGGADVSPTGNNFSVRWTGKIRPRYTETVNFIAETDDGVRVWINNQLIIDQWYAWGQWVGSIPLVAGQLYDIRVEYREYDNHAQAKLFWSSANQSTEIVPQSRLYPAP